jgi:hypothetical protein
LNGATSGAGAGAEVGAEFAVGPEFEDEAVAPFVTVGFVAVFGDGNTLAAEPIPLLHPQPKSPRTIRKVRNKKECDLLGLKEAGSDARQALLPAALKDPCGCISISKGKILGGGQDTGFYGGKTPDGRVNPVHRFLTL